MGRRNRSICEEWSTTDTSFGLRTSFTSLAQFSDASYAVSIDRVVFVVSVLVDDGVCVVRGVRLTFPPLEEVQNIFGSAILLG